MKYVRRVLFCKKYCSSIVSAVCKLMVLSSSNMLLFAMAHCGFLQRLQTFWLMHRVAGTTSSTCRALSTLTLHKGTVLFYTFPILCRMLCIGRSLCSSLSILRRSSTSGMQPSTHTTYAVENTSNISSQMELTKTLRVAGTVARVNNLTPQRIYAPVVCTVEE